MHEVFTREQRLRRPGVALLAAYLHSGPRSIQGLGPFIAGLKGCKISPQQSQPVPSGYRDSHKADGGRKGGGGVKGRRSAVSSDEYRDVHRRAQMRNLKGTYCARFNTDAES